MTNAAITSDGNGWSTPSGYADLTASGETPAVVRKKVLLRILARREADLANIHLTDADIQLTVDAFRQSYDLVEDDKLAQWIEASGIRADGYAAAMRDLTIVRLVEEHYAKEIDELVPGQIAITAARFRVT
jgi:hypothetical protein